MIPLLYAFHSIIEKYLGKEFSERMIQEAGHV
jgi:hypothetical protein